MDRYVLPSVATVVFASFELWMSKGGVDTFALVINFINDQWVLINVTIRLFGVSNTSGLPLRAKYALSLTLTV